MKDRQLGTIDPTDGGNQLLLGSIRPVRMMFHWLGFIVHVALDECVSCGGRDLLLLSFDHIHPVHLGGGDELDNLQALCRRCNSRKGAVPKH